MGDEVGPREMRQAFRDPCGGVMRENSKEQISLMRFFKAPGFLHGPFDLSKNIELFEYWGKSDGTVKGRVRFLKGAEGQPDIVHGGAIFTLLDQTMGSSCFLIEKPSVTASVKIDYQEKLSVFDICEIVSVPTKIDGKKTYLKSKILVDGRNICVAEGLFIETEISREFESKFRA